MEKRNAIIIYSWSTIWSMKNKSGAPSFYKTIELYLKKDWEVYLVLTESSNGGVEIVDQDHLFVLPKWKTDNLIGPANWTKGFLLFKIFRFNCYAKKVTKEIMKKNDNIRLFYAYEVNGVEVAKQMADEYKKPLVTRFQGTVATYFRMNIATKIKHHFRLKALKESADLVIMTDDGTQGLKTLKKLGNQSGNIKFWKNGLDIWGEEDIFSEKEVVQLRIQLGISHKEIMLLTVSRLQNWKRVDRAIETLEKIVESDKRYKLVIVGDGVERENLQKLVKIKKLENNVIFAGAVEHELVYKYMMASDIFLSLYDMSNVGNPLLEALVLGKCIVTLDVGDTNTVIENDKNGILLKISELHKLPGIILELGKNKDKREALGRQAKEYAKKNLYSWDRRMEMEYAEVLKII